MALTASTPIETTARTPQAHDTVSSLKRRLEKILEPILPRDNDYALLDFPNYSNVGDSAIWLGERRLLRRLGASVGYTTDFASYSPERLRACRGTILLSGGGNIGDLWPAIQHFRETVIRTFPDRTVIQLPQSIHFKEKASLTRARAFFNAHPDLTLLLRDHRSLEIARNEFRARSILCPDMAFALGFLNRPDPPTQDIVWLSRTDIESARNPVDAPHAGVDRGDWLEDEPSVVQRANEFLTRRVRRRPWIFPWLSRPLSLTRDRLAGRRLRRGCRFLGRGRVVITDRLHGHILSLLLGIPHVILDNNNGKLRSFYETWTKDSGLAVWADSPADALEQARALAREINPSRPPIPGTSSAAS